MTSDEFLVWAEQQPGDEKYELHDGQVVQKYGPTNMQAEKIAHVHAKGMAYRALQDASIRAGLPCQAFVDGASIKCDEKRTFIPDAVLQCSPITDDQSLVLSDPVVIVEVLSPSTSGVDHGMKFRAYLEQPSMAHYLIVDLDGTVVIHHQKQSDHVRTTLHRDGHILLDPPGSEIAVADLLNSLEIG